MDTAPLSTPGSIKRSDFTGTAAEWELVRDSALFSVRAGAEETVWGDTLEIDTAISCAANKEPYGPPADAHYCDPGWQADKKKRFPTNTASRIRAAWSYSHHANVTSKYSAEQLSKLHSCIEGRWKAVIDPKGPPSTE